MVRGKASIDAVELSALRQPELAPLLGSLDRDTVEVRSSSLLVPTISFNGLAFLTLLREAPNGSIKPTAPGREDIRFYTSQKPTSGPE
jgi:hypothetical protein